MVFFLNECRNILNDLAPKSTLVKTYYARVIDVVNLFITFPYGQVQEPETLSLITESEKKDAFSQCCFLGKVCWGENSWKDVSCRFIKCILILYTYQNDFLSGSVLKTDTRFFLKPSLLIQAKNYINLF